ncbi:TIGR00269 family protein [Caldivirga sp.]|jgi:uncharacterized protein (TIGR00269 family)|uniref:TIGR00269 family protein n=1 Tax=Caldivirga sp. TaxID=2080243 RepID=UPI003D0E8A24
MVTLCDRCGVREARYLKASSGEKLCLNCLFSSIEDTVARTVRRYRLIVSGDRVGIAVSGGKDSLVLMYLLGKLRRLGRIPKDVELIAFSIDEEQPYSCIRRANSTDYVAKLTEEFNIGYRVFRFSELFGVTAFDIAQGLWGKGVNTHMCTICGVMRRRAMNIVGKMLNLTKIATGHNLDDEAQTVLLNVTSNDIKRFAWFGATPSNDVAEEEFIPRIKPLRFIREEEVALYAYYHGIPLMTIECPFVYNNPRYELKFTLARWERDNPNVKYSMVSFGDELSRMINERFKGQVKLNKCTYCGFPTSGNVCRVCDLLKQAGLLEKYLGHIRLTSTQQGA